MCRVLEAEGESERGASEEQKKASVTGVGNLEVEAGGSEVRLEKVERPPAGWGLLDQVLIEPLRGVCVCEGGWIEARRPGRWPWVRSL